MQVRYKSSWHSFLITICTVCSSTLSHGRERHYMQLHLPCGFDSSVYLLSTYYAPCHLLKVTYTSMPGSCREKRALYSLIEVKKHKIRVWFSLLGEKVTLIKSNLGDGRIYLCKLPGPSLREVSEGSSVGAWNRGGTPHAGSFTHPRAELACFYNPMAPAQQMVPVTLAWDLLHHLRTKAISYS